MKKKILLIGIFCLIFSVQDINAIKIGNYDVAHDLAEGYRNYSSLYGEERDNGLHDGMDIACPEGTPIHPAIHGSVDSWGEDEFNGKFIAIVHVIGGQEVYKTYYLHLSEHNENLHVYGRPVAESTILGKSGDTGRSNGNHLHFEVQEGDDEGNWTPICPYESKKELEDKEKYEEWEYPEEEDGDEDDSMEEDEEDGEENGEEGDGHEPGGDRPDDNESFATSNPSSLISDSKSRFYRLAPKKGKTYILHLWNLEKLLEERGQYFESLSSGGTLDETYLNNLNTKINENYNLLSVNNLQYRKERSETPDVVIFRHGYFGSTSSLINKSSEAWRRIIPSFSPLWVRENPLMVIPTGGLYGMENSEQFKSTLADYVSQGGTLIVFAQQHGYEYTLLPTPDEKPLECYGWREDQSCRSNSMYVDNWHPALSSAAKSLISSPIDGYFADYPSDSTVLLSRRINGMPAMLAYPYGEGRVVVTSMYEDWGYSHRQSTAQGRAIVRDLITWAKNPDLEIPEYNLRDNPDPEVNLNLELKNISDKTASKAKVLWLDPGRNLYLEEERLIAIPPGENITIPVSHAFSGIPDNKLGIWHIDYILYDSEGDEIQPPTEIDSGRFSLSRPPTEIFEGSDLAANITISDEEVVWGSQASFPTHFTNRAAQNKRLHL